MVLTIRNILKSRNNCLLPVTEDTDYMNSLPAECSIRPEH